MFVVIALVFVMSLFAHGAWRFFVSYMVNVACIAAAFVCPWLAFHVAILHAVRIKSSLIKNYFVALLPFHGAQPWRLNNAKAALRFWAGDHSSVMALWTMPASLRNVLFAPFICIRPYEPVYGSRWFHARAKPLDSRAHISSRCGMSLRCQPTSRARALYNWQSCAAALVWVAGTSSAAMAIAPSSRFMVSAFRRDR